jgi:hypothetical protein
VAATPVRFRPASFAFTRKATVQPDKLSDRYAAEIKEQRKAEEWFRDYANVKQLAAWLVENGRIETLKELLDYFGACWKWTNEWNEMQAELAPEREDPNECTECARSFGPHYRGPCGH